MHNAILDRLPESYEGYLMRTDFRIGIQINQALADNELTDLEKQSVALSLLYGKGLPSDIGVAADGLAWFMNGGAKPAIDGEGDGQRSFDFDIDSPRIWSGFRRIYGIDLSRERLHWFQFLAMLADLGECAFTDVIGYRMTRIEKMPKDMQNDYRRLRDLYKLPAVLDEESQQVADEFMAAFKG